MSRWLIYHFYFIYIYTQCNFVWFSAAWLQNIAQARRTIWMTKLACFIWICICMGRRCSTKERKTGNVNYNFPFGRWFQLFNQCHWTCRYLTRVKCMGFFPCLRGCTKTISCLWGEGGRWQTMAAEQISTKLHGDCCMQSYSTVWNTHIMPVKGRL